MRDFRTSLNTKLKRINPETPIKAPIQSTVPPKAVPTDLGIQRKPIISVRAFFIALNEKEVYSSAHAFRRYGNSLQPPDPLSVHEKSYHDSEYRASSSCERRQCTCFIFKSARRTRYINKLPRTEQFPSFSSDQEDRFLLTEQCYKHHYSRSYSCNSTTRVIESRRLCESRYYRPRTLRAQLLTKF